jgi:hypothetical protein
MERAGLAVNKKWAGGASRERGLYAEALSNCDSS